MVYHEHVLREASLTQGTADTAQACDRNDHLCSKAKCMVIFKWKYLIRREKGLAGAIREASGGGCVTHCGWYLHQVNLYGSAASHISFSGQVTPRHFNATVRDIHSSLQRSF